MGYSFVDKFGSIGSGNGEFDGPWGIAEDATRLYVADLSNNRIQIFNKDTFAYIDEIAGFGSDLGGVAVDDNYIYISRGSGVELYDKDTLIFYDAITGLGSGIAGVKIDATRIFMPDLDNDKVVVYNKSSLAYITEFGSSGSGDGEFSLPYGIAIDALYIYISEAGNNRVQIFNSSTYVFVDKFGSVGSGNGQFLSPKDLAITATTIVVPDYADRFQVFNKVSPFDFIESIGVVGIGDREFNNPSGITIGSGIVYISDTSNNRIQLFSPPAPSTPTGLTATCTKESVPQIPGFSFNIISGGF